MPEGGNCHVKGAYGDPTVVYSSFLRAGGQGGHKWLPEGLLHEPGDGAWWWREFDNRGKMGLFLAIKSRIAMKNSLI